ncbi:MAG: putative quinol monooxygenase [Sphingomonadaceae bacterium]|nr:putative quinol monooxygenase [Sphingomonadaceae bacterium]
MAYAVLASVPVKPEHFASARAAVAGLVERTLAETGCHAFQPHRPADGTPTVLIYEVWADRAAFDFHHEQDYTRAVYASYEDWLAGPVTITELESL